MTFTNGGGFVQAIPVAPTTLPASPTFDDLTVTDTTTTEILIVNNVTETGNLLVTGTENVTTLNATNLNAFGAVSIPSLSHRNAVDNTVVAITTTAYTTWLPGLSTTVAVPASNIITIHWRVWIADTGAPTTQTILVSPLVTNATTSTVVFAPSDNRSSGYSGATPTASGAATAGVVTASSLGSFGDSLTVELQMRSTTANLYEVFRGELTVIPSP